jgi:hypothetical protein
MEKFGPHFLIKNKSHDDIETVINFDCQLSPSWNKGLDSSDLSALDATAFRYDVLLGDIVMIADGHDFSARWGWIPIVDFVVSLREIADELTDGGDVESEFTFTESDAVMRFKRAGDSVLISASYVRFTAQVSLTEFINAVTDFTAKVAQELGQRYPLLLNNETFVGFFSNT